MKKTQKVILGREYKSLEVCDNQTSAGNKPECPVMLLSPKGSGLDQRERERSGETEAQREVEALLEDQK